MQTLTLAAINTFAQKYNCWSSKNSNSVQACARTSPLKYP